MTDITGISKQYLKKFLDYARKELDYEPIILGGWAIFALTKIEQSVDVDVLLKSGKDVSKLKPFFNQNGFKMEKDRFGNMGFGKKLDEPQTIGGIKIEDVIFDIMTVNEPNQLSENKKIEIPWKLSFEYNAKTKIDKTEFKIPAPELLLIYKTKALRDRSHDKHRLFEHMQHKKIWAARKDFKIEKDKRDIKNLIKTGKIDFEKLNEILSKTKFKEMFEQTQREITSQ